MKTACSFHHPQMRRIRRRSVLVPCRAGGDVELRQVRIRLYRRVGFPEDVKLSLRVGDGQPWRKDAMVVVAVDPDWSLRRIVAIAGRSAPYLGDIGCAGALQRTRQQIDRDIGGLPVDRGAAGVTVTRLPALRRRRGSRAGGCSRNRLTT